MGEVADAVGIQFRLLNTSRGPAVRSLWQCDKALIAKMRKCWSQPGLHIRRRKLWTRGSMRGAS
jgi:tRNA uridine 5-carboxymethylaminomethyl modification enzyme